MSESAVITKVSLWTGSNDPLPEVTIDVPEPHKAAAIALRHFRRQGYRVFASGAYVNVETGTKRQQFGVRDIIAWLKQPEQADFVVQQAEGAANGV